MKSTLAAVALAAGTVAGAGTAQAVYVVDTGPAPPGAPAYLLWNDGPQAYQHLGVTFELAAATQVGSLAAWLQVFDAVGALRVDLHAGATPSGLLVYSGLFAPPGRGTRWFGASGLNLALEAGAYTVTFTATGGFVGGAPFAAAVPLGTEWVDNFVEAPGWRPIESLDFGLRVAAVPEPAAWLLAGLGLLAVGTAARRRS